MTNEEQETQQHYGILRHQDKGPHPRDWTVGSTITCRKNLSNLDPGIEETSAVTASNESLEPDFSELDRKRTRTLAGSGERFSKSYRKELPDGKKTWNENFEYRQTNTTQRKEFRDQRIIEQRERMQRFTPGRP